MAHPSRLAAPQSLRAVIGGLIDPRPTSYRGVAMRSRLEADFARHLDAMQVPWVYEPETFGRRGSGYLPDFLLPRPDGRHYVEIKPTLRQVPGAQRRMLTILARHPDALLVVVCAEGSRWFAREPDGSWRDWTAVWKHA